MANKKGFTLIELLVVICALMILSAIIVGASSKVMQSSRRQRFNTTCDVLKTAIMRYYTEYGQWPVSIDDDADIEPRESSSEQWYKWNESNYKVIEPMRRKNNSSDANPDEIRFFDETTLLIADGSKTKALADSTSSGKNNSIVYIVGKGHFENSPKQWQYYQIEIEFELAMVNVTSLGGAFATGDTEKDADDEY